MNDKCFYYTSFSEDVVLSKNQNIRLPKHYRWIHRSVFYRIYSWIAYLLARLFGFFYCRFVLHIKVINRKILKKYRKQAYFLYANHTQPIGDAFIPARICGAKRIDVIVSTANLGIPVLGKLLPAMGALPIPDTVEQMKEFLAAIDDRVKKKHSIVVYPEAHVWPYYTKIRPFPATSFRFPIERDAPVFCMTTTYQKNKDKKKPKIVIYIDGPFPLEEGVRKKEKQKQLCSAVRECMEKRSRNSNYEYISYIKKAKEEIS